MVYPSMKLKKPAALRDDKNYTNHADGEDLLGENLPWTKSPATNNRTQYLSTSDVDILSQMSDRSKRK